jgi:flagellar protein FliL
MRVMTDSAAPSEKAPSEAPSRRFSLRTLLIVGGLFLLGLAGGGVAMIGPDRLLGMVAGGSTQAPTSNEAGSDSATRWAGESSGATAVLLMDDHIVNLVSGSGPSTRFARVRVAVVYDPVLVPIGSLQEKRPFLRDTFHGFLSQLTERDLEGSFGLVMIREELLRRAQKVAGSTGIREILITDLVIQ